MQNYYKKRLLSRRGETINIIIAIFSGLALTGSALAAWVSHGERLTRIEQRVLDLTSEVISMHDDIKSWTVRTR